MNWQRYNLHVAEWGMPEISVRVLNVNGSIFVFVVVFRELGPANNAANLP